MTIPSAAPASDRVRVRRGAHRAEYDPAAVHAVLDAGTVAHVGVVTADGPVVLPMAYGRSEDHLYLHGAAANALLGAGTGAQVCATVTVLDGLVIARSAFHNSMNYRCVVVRGVGRAVVDPQERLEAMRRVTDHVVANWDTRRAPNPSELRRTAVVALALTEASAKVRSGDPVDDADDLGGPQWAGVVPLVTRWGLPIPSADLAGGIVAPAPVVALSGSGRAPGGGAGPTPAP